MNCCDIEIPDYSQVACREIPSRVDTLKVYKRIPRKLKKQVKKKREQYFKVMGLTISVVMQVAAMWKPLGIDLYEPLNNYEHHIYKHTANASR